VTPPGKPIRWHGVAGVLAVVELEQDCDLGLVFLIFNRRHLNAEFVDLDPVDVLERLLRAVGRVIGPVVESLPITKGELFLP
jgi:hypothetical protein